MARRSNAELSEATRASLLARAREAFATHGYADAPLDDLVRAAGLTKGALYHHFGSKRGLFEAVLHDLVAEVGQRVDAALAAHPRSRKALLAASEAWLLAMLDAGARRILLLDAPAVLGHSAVRAFDVESTLRPLAALLGDLQRDGEIAPDLDAVAAAHLLAGALDEAALWIGETEAPRRSLAAAVDTIDRLLEGLARRTVEPAAAVRKRR
jgi:AcrR family transcriptional regulator